MIVATEPAIGSIITFSVVYPTGPKSYDYAAIRAGNGLWYMTGTNAGIGMNWRQFIDAFEPILKGPLYVVTEKRELMS